MSKVLEGFQPQKIDMSGVHNEPDVEKALEIETKKLLKQKAQQKMDDMRDAQYYACVVFACKRDKDAFINELKNIEIEGETFIDGYELAKKMGININMSANLPKPHFVKSIKIKNNGITLKR